MSAFVTKVLGWGIIPHSTQIATATTIAQWIRGVFISQKKAKTPTVLASEIDVSVTAPPNVPVTVVVRINQSAPAQR